MYRAEPEVRAVQLLYDLSFTYQWLGSARWNSYVWKKCSPSNHTSNHSTTTSPPPAMTTAPTFIFSAVKRNLFGRGHKANTGFPDFCWNHRIATGYYK